MSVRGSLKTMAIADLFDWLDRRQLRGELTLDRASVTRRFDVEGGFVKGASSTDPTEYLGQLLLNAGLLSEEDLRDAYAEQTNDGVLLGQILLSSGQVTEQALRETIELKICESFYAALSWEDGTFAFEPHGAESPRVLEYEVHLPIRTLMKAGAERAEAWRALRQIIPSDETQFYVPDRSWLDRAKPGSPSALILQDVLRGLTVREIILERHALPFLVYQRLAELVQRGILQLDRRSTPRTTSQTAMTPVQMVEAARGRAAGGDLSGAIDMARRAMEAAPEDPEVKRKYQELERKLFAELSRTLLSQYRVPRLLKGKEDLEGMALSAEERYLVNRIDGRWDLLSLMRVSPLREVDALITINRLAERGVIALE